MCSKSRIFLMRAWESDSMLYHRPQFSSAIDQYRPIRLLMYSHDTFGLGHLRRCSTIAHALVDHFDNLEVLIISGSQIAEAFEPRAHVNFIKIPSVLKLSNGEYVAAEAGRDINAIIQLREAMIYRTGMSFAPDMIIVDKEPLGLKGEMERTLTCLKAKGCCLVLGLREVLDDPGLLEAEWRRRDALRKMEALYDQIWVYGPKDFWNPLEGLNISKNLSLKITYTGFLRRAIPRPHDVPRLPPSTLLATAGGGGDGAELMRQLVKAHHFDAIDKHNLVLVAGPFMSAENREFLHEQAKSSVNMTIIDFDTDIETLMQEADIIVSMGGYNTFCEILSLDKRALIVPRLSPRREQFIRADRARQLGYVDMLLPEQAGDPALLSTTLRQLQFRPLPSQTPIPPDLRGLECIVAMMANFIKNKLLAPVKAENDLVIG